MLFAGPSDLKYPFEIRFLRFFLQELAFLPWKIIPFYFLFYFLIPRYFQKGYYFKTGFYLFICLTICVFGYRSLISPLSNLMYGETPEFSIYSLKRILYTLTDLLPALGIASAAKLLKGSIQAQKKEQALKEEKLASELNFLKAQTNPHFLFNTLNNLYGLARKQDENTAPSILKLSNIMRYILYECSGQRIPIKNEIQIIEDYIELEKLRYNDRLVVRFQRSIGDQETEIAPLILLPFVENAFKHGASEARFDSFIHINLELKNNQLHFQVMNSHDNETEHNFEGIGLKNVKRQLDLIYGNNYTLHIQPATATFSINLMIQLDTDGS